MVYSLPYKLYDDTFAAEQRIPFYCIPFLIKIQSVEKGFKKNVMRKHAWTEEKKGSGKSRGSRGCYERAVKRVVGRLPHENKR